jgi:hypothetical protein
MMRVLAPPLFAKAKKGQLLYGEVEKFLHLERQVIDGDVDMSWVKGWWQFALVKDIDENTIQSHSRHLFNFSRDRFSVVPAIANKIVDRFISQ